MFHRTAIKSHVKFSLIRPDLQAWPWSGESTRLPGFAVLSVVILQIA